MEEVEEKSCLPTRQSRGSHPRREELKHLTRAASFEGEICPCCSMGKRKVAPVLSRGHRDQINYYAAAWRY